jgi:hypothetical protein
MVLKLNFIWSSNLLDIRDTFVTKEQAYIKLFSFWILKNIATEKGPFTLKLFARCHGFNLI